jgi:hypothetical protein
MINLFALPTICDNCNTVFSSSLIGRSEATVISIKSESGLCPTWGSMPDATYNIIKHIVAKYNVVN